MPSLTNADLLAVSGRSATDVIASGAGGYAAHWNGTSWAMFRTFNETASLKSIAITPLDVDLAGTSSLTRRFRRSLPW